MSKTRFFTYHVSRITYHVSRITYHVSRITSIDPPRMAWDELLLPIYVLQLIDIILCVRLQ
jgi:hypothetical protein